jgi:dihydroxyacetone kinase
VSEIAPTVTGDAFVARLRPTLDRLRAHADELNALDAVAGDGDLGVTVTLAIDAVRETLDSTAPDTPIDELLRAIGRTVAQRAPSTSGTLIAFAILAAAKVDPAGDAGLGGPAVALRRLDAAVETIATRGKVGVGDRTMLDALEPAARAWRVASEAGGDARSVLRAAAEAAAAGAAATTSMEPTVGRAAWLKDRAMGHPDAGASVVAMAFAAAVAAESSV